MTEEDAQLLEYEKQKLIFLYASGLKGTSPLLRQSMQQAYGKGINDTVTFLRTHGFDIVRVAAPQTKPEPAQPTEEQNGIA